MLRPYVKDLETDENKNKNIEMKNYFTANVEIFPLLLRSTGLGNRCCP